MLLLVLILVLYMFPQFPLVDVLVDRVCALIEGSLEEQGAHCDGEGKGGSSAEQQGVQARRDRRRTNEKSFGYTVIKSGEVLGHQHIRA